MANIKFSALPAGTRAFNDDLVGLTGASVASIYKRRMIGIVKSVDETIQSSSTLHDDDELFFNGQIDKTYWILMAMILDSGSTPDFKFAFSAPAGATVTRADANTQILFRNTTGYNFTVDATSSTFLQTAGGVGQWGWTFMCEMGGTAGDVNYQWSQNVSTASDTTVKRGATMVVWESD